MSDQQQIEFTAMRGNVSAKAGIHLCEQLMNEGRPPTRMEYCRLRLLDIDTSIEKRKLRDAQRAAGKKSSTWSRMDDVIKPRPKLRIENASDGAVRMYAYGPIGDEYGGIDPAAFVQELDRIPRHQDVELHLSSEGGSYLDGLAIGNSIRARGNVDVIIDSLAASAGSIIAQFARTIGMARDSWQMIHFCTAKASGEAQDLRRAADQMDRHNDEIVNIYARRWNGTDSELRSALERETWFSADECVFYSLADYVTNAAQIAARFDPSKWGYSKTPTVLQIAAHHESLSPATLRAGFKLSALEFAEEL